MSDSPTFEDKDEAIRYWKQLAEERKNDFDELEEMSKELEKDQDRQIEQLENDNKRIVTNCKSKGMNADGPEFRIDQLRDDDHREKASHFE